MAKIDFDQICEGVEVRDREGRSLGMVREIHREVSTAGLGPSGPYLRVTHEDIGRGEIYDVPLTSILEMKDNTLIVDYRPDISSSHEQTRIPGMPWKE